MIFSQQSKYASAVRGVCLLAFFIATACLPQRYSKTSGQVTGDIAPSVLLPRADPAYLQWLERQSMLRDASQISSDISGTQILWRNSAAEHRPGLLLEAAPNWFEVNPQLCDVGRPLFSVLAERETLNFLLTMGFSGVYVAPSGERADVWGAPAISGESEEANVASLHFDSTLGSDDDFDKMADSLEKAQIQLGGDLLSAATGMGPDFMLQARQASRFDGIYAMVAVPQQHWDKLPVASSEWDCSPLPSSTTALFVNEGLLPSNLTRDFLPWVTRGGWAATGEIRGSDGKMRRWLYRYSNSVRHPVLLWQDPSGNARRIFSAAVIRHTGLQRQSLAGINVEPLMGLDARSDTSHNQTAREKQWRELTPGSEAIFDIAHEAHRYGGWLVQADILPRSLTTHVLGGSVDFARDTITWPASAYALLSGDVVPLAVGLRDSIAARLEHNRLARGLHDAWYVDWRPLLDMPDGANLVAKAQSLSGNFAAIRLDDGLRLQTTPALLADHALRQGIGQAAQTDEQALQRACLSLLSWRIGLPGLVFISPQDLLIMPGSAMSTREVARSAPGKDGRVPSWQPSGGATFSSLLSRRMKGADFLNIVSSLLLLRRETALSRGVLRTVMTGPTGCIAAITELPDKRYWLLATNFSAQHRDFSIVVPKGATGKNIRDLTGSDASSIHNGKLELSLKAYQTRHFLLF